MAEQTTATDFLTSCDHDSPREGEGGLCKACQETLDEMEQERAEADGQRPPYVDVFWVDDGDGCGPRKLSNGVRCF